MRVLVVEDDDLARTTLGRILERAGHDVRTASSAGEAAAVADAFSPEAVLVDRRLGDSDGVELARSLRESAAPAAAYVLLSGDVHPGLPEGIDRVLLKPVGPREVLAALEPR